MFHQVGEQGELATSVVITFQVMAFAGMSPGHPHGVRPFIEGGQEKLGAHTTRTGDADNPDIGRVFHPADTRQVRCTVTAPVAEKTDNFWFPI